MMIVDENFTRFISRMPLISRDRSRYFGNAQHLAKPATSISQVAARDQSARTFPRGKTVENSQSPRSPQRDARWLVVYIRATTSAIAALSNFPRRAIPASTGGWRGW
jgi:hypothetical protein